MLTTCRECNSQVSTSATICPHCGNQGPHGLRGQSFPTGYHQAPPYHAAPMVNIHVNHTSPKRGATVFGSLGNVLWIVLFGGFFTSLGYLVAGVLLCVTVIGIPFGMQCFKLAMHSMLPFDHQVVNRERSIGSGILGTVFNIIWLVFFGWPIALSHIFCALLCAITIVGIPFAMAHLKLAALALWPFGKDII